MRVNEFPKLVVAGNMSGNIVSDAMPITQGYVGAVQAVWTGTPAGTLELLISNDGITYSVYTGSTTVVSGPGDFIWNLTTCGFNFVRVQYTATSGTGSLNVSSSYKGN